MLRGRFEHTLDTKGRLNIPSRFRDHMHKRYSDVIVVTNYDRCLVGYPLEEWENLERRTANLPQFQKEVRAFLRYFIAAAVECPIDKQGRILIPPTLREFAELKKQVVVVGLLKKFEIWSRTKWQQEFTKSQKNLESASNVLSELGF